MPVLLAAVLGWTPAGAVDVVITSEQKGAEVIALGMIPFPITRGNAESVPYNPGDVLAADLDFSGRFRVHQAAELTPATRTRFEEEGALGLLRGAYALDGENFTLRCELVDLSTGELILGKVYSGPRSELRAAAHRFADELVLQLTGEKGIAQTRLAYVSRRGGGKEIWAMDYDGANAAAVTRNGSINIGPAFLGSKNKVIFTSYASGIPGFYTADPARPGTQQPVYPSAGMNSAPSYNRQDRELAFASTMDGNSEIYRRPVEGGRAERLTFSGSIETSPSWSPNGYEIVFISDRTGRPMLYVMDRSGSNTRRLTYDLPYCGSPAWSPRGDRIAFSVMDDGNNFNIYTISPDGSNPVRLTSGGSNESPAWSPDGRFIAFSSTRLGAAEIFVMRADGGNLRRLTFSGGNTMPAWSDF